MNTLKGKVIKKSGDKTVSVEVVRTIVHPLYRKRQTRSKKYLVHDEKNEAVIGTEVTIKEGRPRSAKKRWELVYGA